MALLAIRKGTTRIVRLSILYNGAALDIRSDTVQFMLKTNKTDLDSAALVNTTADVTTYGADGVAVLTLSTTHTNQTVGKKYYEILWTRSNGEVYVLDAGEVAIIAKLSGITL